MGERLSVEGLRYARAVRDTGSFSAAARSQGVTQPALSNVIASLEDRLGGKLFHRSHRGVTPTDFGLRMLPLIEQALGALDSVSAEARRWTTPAAAVLRVGVSPLVNPILIGRIHRLSTMPRRRRPRPGRRNWSCARPIWTNCAPR